MNIKDLNTIGFEDRKMKEKSKQSFYPNYVELKTALLVI